MLGNLLERKRCTHDSVCLPGYVDYAGERSSLVILTTTKTLVLCNNKTARNCVISSNVKTDNELEGHHELTPS